MDIFKIKKIINYLTNKEVNKKDIDDYFEIINNREINSNVIDDYNITYDIGNIRFSLNLIDNMDAKKGDNIPYIINSIRADFIFKMI